MGEKKPFATVHEEVGGEMESCRRVVDLVCEAERLCGLGREVLWEACNEMDIPADKLYAAICNGYLEWVK